ncbi:MAG: ABC-2 family transporter protein [Patescibacteria group bacterium]
MKKILYYFKIWLIISKNSFLNVIHQRLALAIFLVGKILRFVFFLAFLYFIVNSAGTLAGYSSHQAIFFFLTFNLIDIVSQFLFRDVYRFRPLVASGDFDLILVKPLNALFRVLMGGADFIDLVTIPPVIYALIWLGQSLNPSYFQVLMYIFLILNGLLIATSFHIAVLALGIITLEIDHTIMIYRDLMSLGRFPIDIYKEPLKGILTYLIPVGIMISLPTKALLGLVSPIGLFISFAVGVTVFVISLKLWDFALTKYTSASS